MGAVSEIAVTVQRTQVGGRNGKLWRDEETSRSPRPQIAERAKAALRQVRGGAFPWGPIQWPTQRDENHDLSEVHGRGRDVRTYGWNG